MVVNDPKFKKNALPFKKTQSLLKTIHTFKLLKNEKGSLVFLKLSLKKMSKIFCQKVF